MCYRMYGGSHLNKSSDHSGPQVDQEGHWNPIESGEARVIS